MKLWPKCRVGLQGPGSLLPLTQAATHGKGVALLVTFYDVQKGAVELFY